MPKKSMKFHKVDINTGERSARKIRVNDLPKELRWANMEGTKDWTCTNTDVALKVTLIGELTPIGDGKFTDTDCEWKSNRTGKLHSSFGQATNDECRSYQAGEIMSALGD